MNIFKYILFSKEYLYYDEINYHKSLMSNLLLNYLNKWTIIIVFKPIIYLLIIICKISMPASADKTHSFTV